MRRIRVKNLEDFAIATRRGLAEQVMDAVRQQEAQRNFDKAFEALYKQYSPYLFAILKRVEPGMDEHAATSLVNDVFFDLYKTLNSRDLNYPLKDFLRKRLLHRRIDEYRKRQRDAMGHAVSIEGLPSDQFGFNPESNAVFTVTALNPADYEFLFLHFCDGLTIAEIATAKGIERKQVEAQLKRERRRLKAKVTEQIGRDARTTPSGGSRPYRGDADTEEIYLAIFVRLFTADDLFANVYMEMGWTQLLARIRADADPRREVASADSGCRRRCSPPRRCRRNIA